MYSREDSERAWAQRRADLAGLVGVEVIMNQVDARCRRTWLAAELQRQTPAILVRQIDS